MFPDELDGPADEDGAGSFLIMFVGGDPSSCLIDVTTNCSDEPKNAPVNFNSFYATCKTHFVQQSPL